MAKYCGNCGAKLDDDAKVCGKCRIPVDEIPIKIKGLKKANPEEQKKSRLSWWLFWLLSF